jgi:hypothetical protein
MALTIDNCLIPQGSGTNQMYGGCCCSVVCQITNNDIRPVEITDLIAVFGGNFAVQNTTLTYQGSEVIVPFFVDPNTSFQIGIDYCAGDVGLTDTLTIETFVDGTDVTIFNFDFEAVDLSESIDTASIDFGTVNVNTINPVNITITNPTVCCYNYAISTDCPDVFVSPTDTTKLCLDEFESVQIRWEPSTIGPISCNVYVNTECQEFVIPITGTAIEAPAPPSGGNDVSGKRTVVDCPTGDCRLFNGQPGFAQTTKNAINQISRATRPKGGPGRGTNFR